MGNNSTLPVIARKQLTGRKNMPEHGHYSWIKKEMKKRKLRNLAKAINHDEKSVMSCAFGGAYKGVVCVRGRSRNGHSNIFNI